MHDPYQQVVYGAASDDIADVWIQGRRVLADDVVLTVSEADVVSEAGRAARELFAAAGLADLVPPEQSDDRDSVAVGAMTTTRGG